MKKGLITVIVIVAVIAVLIGSLDSTTININCFCFNGFIRSTVFIICSQVTN